MRHASTWPLAAAAIAFARVVLAQSEGAPVAAPAAAPAEGAPATGPAPAPEAEVKAPEQVQPSPAQTDPGPQPAPAPAPEQAPSTVAPSPVTPAQSAGRGSSVPQAPVEDPATLRATTAVDAVAPADDPSRVRFALELGAGFSGGGRFPSDTIARSHQETIDGAYGIGALVGTRSALYGLAVELAGLGRDHYATPGGGTTISASYRVDTLWLQGRWYFSEKRPAFYVSGALGPALPVARATGTRLAGDALVAPPVPYECTETGKVGLGLAAGAGAEFDVASAWSLLGDARLTGHVLSRDSSEFGACAPATGSALGGTVRVGVQLRL